MARLIDADELIETAHRIRLDSRERIEQMIESAPTVDIDAITKSHEEIGYDKGFRDGYAQATSEVRPGHCPVCGVGVWASTIKPAKYHDKTSEEEREELENNIALLSLIRGGYNIFDDEERPFYHALSVAISALNKELANNGHNDITRRDGYCSWGEREDEIDADTLRAARYHALPYTHIHALGVDVESYERGWNDALKSVAQFAPTVEPKHGHWTIEDIVTYERSYGGTLYEPVYKCSCCGRVTESYVRGDEPIMPEDADFPEFCGNCGAKMDEAKDGKI